MSFTVSFNRSQLGAFIRSPLGARGARPLSLKQVSVACYSGGFCDYNDSITTVVPKWNLLTYTQEFNMPGQVPSSCIFHFRYSMLMSGIVHDQVFSPDAATFTYQAANHLAIVTAAGYDTCNNPATTSATRQQTTLSPTTTGCPTTNDPYYTKTLQLSEAWDDNNCAEAQALISLLPDSDWDAIPEGYTRHFDFGGTDSFDGLGNRYPLVKSATDLDLLVQSIGAADGDWRTTGYSDVGSLAATVGTNPASLKQACTIAGRTFGIYPPTVSNDTPNPNTRTAWQNTGVVVRTQIGRGSVCAIFYPQGALTSCTSFGGATSCSRVACVSKRLIEPASLGLLAAQVRSVDPCCGP